MGRRDRVYPMALWMTALWWPHDGSKSPNSPRPWFDQAGIYSHLIPFAGHRMAGVYRK